MEPRTTRINAAIATPEPKTLPRDSSCCRSQASGGPWPHAKNIEWSRKYTSEGNNGRALASLCSARAEMTIMFPWMTFLL